MAINVSGLTKYVDEQRLPIIKKSVLESRSASLFNLMVGVKSSANLNLLNTTVQFGDGNSCGWNEAGTSTLSKRALESAPIKVQMSFCDKAMKQYWMQNQVKVAANAEKTLPFEEAFISDIIAGVHAKIEDMVWNGTKGAGSFDGLLTILEAETSHTVKATGADAYALVKDVYTKLPAEILTKEGTAIMIGEDMFRDLTQILVAKNLYNWKTEQTKDMVIIWPGSDIKIYGVGGLNGKNKAIGLNLNDTFYGTDMMGDEEAAKLWYSNDNQEFRFELDFNAGVQVAYPDQVVVGSIV